MVEIHKSLKNIKQFDWGDFWIQYTCLIDINSVCECAVLILY